MEAPPAPRRESLAGQLQKPARRLTAWEQNVLSDVARFEGGLKEEEPAYAVAMGPTTEAAGGSTCAAPLLRVKAKSTVSITVRDSLWTSRLFVHYLLVDQVQRTISRLLSVRVHAALGTHTHTYAHTHTHIYAL